MKVRWPALVVGLTGIYLLYQLVGGAPRDVPERWFGNLPVLNGGRVKPMDSIARNSLLVLSGKQTVRMNNKNLSATRWLMETVFRPAGADVFRVFEINDPDVLGVLGIQQGGQRHYSFNDLQPHLAELQTQANRAQNVRPELRSRFQTAVLRLWDRVFLYWRLQNTLQLADADHVLPGVHGQLEEIAAYEKALDDPGSPAGKKGGAREKALKMFHDRYHTLGERAEFMPLPLLPESEDGWVNMGQALESRAEGKALHPGVKAFASMGDAYRNDDATALREALSTYMAWLKTNAPRALGHAERERVFNRYDPFYRSLILYTMVFMAVFFSFLRWPEDLRRMAFGLLLVAFAVHTGGLFARVVLQGRPPVTNLYSSAVFVGWGAVLLGLILERIFKNGLGSLGASLIGLLTQIVALHLAAQGDTMEMMRAVLDSNFWLATHVITITIGYSSTFLSGALGIVYVLRGLFSKKLTPDSALNITRMVYGIVCFSTFFSFVGTVLGGIWADQSWGRFWGWDPKENGALMIVLWNALILHALWGKLVGQRGLMVMAIFGNVITALSWFGVNMLGIGLHSYGFMDKASQWLLLFTASQLMLMGLGGLPARFWSSPLSPSRPQ